MIHIEKNQPVPEHPELIVFSPTGDYNDESLIECAAVDNPGVAFCSFAASFVKYGGLVYRFENPEKLGKALAELDPNSTHESVAIFKQAEIRRLKRERGDYSADETVVVERAPAPKDPALAPQTNLQTPTNNATSTPTTTPQTPPLEAPQAPTDTTTSTPPVTTNPDPGTTSTTTPTTPPDLGGDTSTTTPPTFPPPTPGDAPTTTPKFDPSIPAGTPEVPTALDSTTSPSTS